MDFLNVCRICLSTTTHKDLSNLRLRRNDHKSVSEIVLFCLSIQIEVDSKISTRICSNCFRKMMTFYKFKLMALESEEYLKSLHASSLVKTEIFLDEDFNKEELTSSDFKADIPLCAEIKQEQITNNDIDPGASLSDDELLSDIKQIKDEFSLNSINKTEKTASQKNSTTTNKSIRLKDNVAGTCIKCGESVSDLKDHMRLHRKHNGKNAEFPKIDGQGLFECRFCQKGFQSKYILKKHEAIHSADRRHACDICSKSYRQKSQLTIHKREAHEKVKTFMCHYCSKEFVNNPNLLRHLRIHTQEKPYSCKECGKSFTTSTACKVHHAVHATESPHSCAVCGRTFAIKKYLDRHMLCHALEKRYPCHHCGRKFNRRTHVKQHEVAVHKIHFLSPTETK